MKSADKWLIKTEMDMAFSCCENLQVGGLEDPGTQWYPSDTQCSHVPRHIMRWLPGEPYLEDQWAVLGSQCSDMSLVGGIPPLNNMTSSVAIIPNTWKNTKHIFPYIPKHHILGFFPSLYEKNMFQSTNQISNPSRHRQARTEGLRTIHFNSTACGRWKQIYGSG